MKNRSTLLNRFKKQKTDNIKSSYLTGSTYFKHELEYIQRGYDFVIGVDEAGRGPLAGPVVACAAAIRHSEFRPKRNEESLKKKTGNKRKRSFASTWVEAQDDGRLDLIRDSKLLSEKQREELYDFIHDHFHVGIGICDYETIDKVNILNATHLAMKKAIASLTRNIKHETRNEKNNKMFHVSCYALRDMRKIILVDGNKIIPNFSLDQKAIINGDKIVKSISAASIVAKVTRDRIMRKMHKKYPAYGFSKHKGYGTKEHREMIKKHGACAIHRQSFKLL